MKWGAVQSFAAWSWGRRRGVGERPVRSRRPADAEHGSAGCPLGVAPLPPNPSRRAKRCTAPQNHLIGNHRTVCWYNGGAELCA